MDPGKGRGADPPPVRVPAHPAWGVVSASPAGVVTASAGPPGRRARRASRKAVADGAVVTGKRTAQRKKGFRAREFADLLTSARRQLGGAPLIVVWDKRLVDHRQASALRARPQPRRRPLGPPEEVPGQPRTPRDRRPHPNRQEPPTRHPTPTRNPRRLHSRDRTRAGASVALSPHPFHLSVRLRKSLAHRQGARLFRGLSIERCNEGGWGYWRAAESRPSKVMSKAFRAVFQRMVQRA